jgi:hypothetical protein
VPPCTTAPWPRLIWIGAPPVVLVGWPWLSKVAPFWLWARMPLASEPEARTEPLTVTVTFARAARGDALGEDALCAVPGGRDRSADCDVHGAGAAVAAGAAEERAERRRPGTAEADVAAEAPAAANALR